MKLCRTMLALLIALSVATLPAAGMTMHSAEPMKMMMPDTGASEVAPGMDDCCPDAKAPCGMPAEQCPAYSCAQSVPLSGISAVQVIHPPVPADRMPALADGSFHPHANGPPFRPPRI